MASVSRMPRPRAALMSDAPPWVTNGSGMPVMGMTPRTMPTLTISWKSSIAGEAARERQPEGSLGAPAHDEDAPDEQREERQHDHAAQEAQLLADAREHEVGGLHGQVSGPSMPLVRPRPKQAAGAHRDLRLLQLEARAQGSAVGSRNEMRRCFW